MVAYLGNVYLVEGSIVKESSFKGGELLLWFGVKERFKDEYDGHSSTSSKGPRS